MSTGKPRRHRHSRSSIEAMHLAGREMSTATVMFHAAVADARGLPATDTKAVDLLIREGPMTHAELGARTGLKPASVSDLIDRLAAKGYVTRSPHPQDGRRILVSADEAVLYEAMAPLFAPWVEQLEDLYATFTKEELETVLRFLVEVSKRQAAVTEQLDNG